MPWSPFELGLFLFLVAGGVSPLQASPRRSSYHLRNSTAFAVFAVCGLDSLRLILPAALASGLLVLGAAQVGSRVGRLVLPAGLRATSATARLLRDTAFLTAGLSLASVIYGWLGDGSYPVPLAHARDLGVFIATSTGFSVTVAALNEIYYRFLTDPVPEAVAVSRELSFLPSDAPLYRLMLVSGSSLQILAQIAYLSYGETALLVMLGWFVLSIEVHATLLKERLRLHVAFRALEASQRALAAGEITGRIVHQTRHQLGLIGISTHLIREALRSGPLERVKVVAQLDRLDGVVTALRGMLSEELGARREDAPDRVAPPEAERRELAVVDLVREEVERLQGKAEQLGVSLAFVALTPGLVAGSTAEAEPLAQGIFNVLENALAVARRSVSVRLRDEAGDVLLVVEDDGPGMPPDILGRAAEPFVTTKEDGSGMGLFIAAAAARRWGGGLFFENREAGGLRVTFRLPARPSAKEGLR